MRPATGRLPSSPGSRSSAASASTAASTATTTTCPAARTRAALRTWSGPPTAPPTRRSPGLGLERGAAPFFLWVHYFDPHAPYEAPAEAMVGARVALRRRGRLRRHPARALLRGLDGGARAPPLLLVTADHGESLGEHGEDTHGIFVYDAHDPRAADAGRSRSFGGASWRRRVARSIDVAPTLLDYAASRRGRCEAARCVAPWPASGSPTSRRTPNRSSPAPVRLGAAARVAHREAQADRGAARRALRPRADAREREDRSAREPERVEAMRRELAARDGGRHAECRAGDGPETRERLAALGYVGTGGGSPPGRRVVIRRTASAW